MTDTSSEVDVQTPAHPCPDCKCPPVEVCDDCRGLGFVTKIKSEDYGTDPLGSPIGSTSIWTEPCPNGCSVVAFY
jgi:hypothetical protein